MLMTLLRCAVANEKLRTRAVIIMDITGGVGIWTRAMRRGQMTVDRGSFNTTYPQATALRMRGTLTPWKNCDAE